MNASVGSH